MLRHDPKVITGKSITRKELYDLVWSVPMTKLAARYGISDVALRKKCVKHDIPTPGLGHWARLQAGQRLPRPKLPKSTSADQIALEPFIRVPDGEPAPPVPEVDVPTRLTNPHEAVSFLRDRLEGSRTDKFERLTGGHEWMHCLRQRNLNRLLLLLQGLFESLESRGHQVKVGPRSEHSQDPDVQIVIEEQHLILRVEERLKKKERPLTKQEKDEFQSRIQWKARWKEQPPQATKRWVQYPDDDLVLRTSAHWEYKGVQSWGDSKHQRLEEKLGLVILGLEAVARFGREKDLDLRRAAAERLAQERARLREGRLNEYRLLLAEDLEDMATAWTKAKQLREFVKACDGKLPSTPEAEEWLDAAKRYTEKLDPFSKPEAIPKSLSPSDEVLEQELAGRDRNRPARPDPTK